MKTKVTKSKKLVKVSDTALLSLVASKLKDRVLFPQQVEYAKKYLQNVKFPPL
jgi:stalled ribosome alternative rescue factor ArfA